MEPWSVAGNIENFTGAIQVPLGIAGPILVHGEHAQGEFYIPLATTEGTLVASYNRGMRLLGACGGVKATVVEQFMQRAPVFMFEDAVQARDFGAWVCDQFDAIKHEAERTTRHGKLHHIEQYQIGPARFLRFNYITGDAAGQNLCGKATAAACEWIRSTWPGKLEYLLSGNIDTDKKHSVMNTLHTRGRRVIATPSCSTAVTTTGHSPCHQQRGGSSLLARSTSIAQRRERRQERRPGPAHGNVYTSALDGARDYPDGLSENSVAFLLCVTEQAINAETRGALTKLRTAAT